MKNRLGSGDGLMQKYQLQSTNYMSIIAQIKSYKCKKTQRTKSSSKGQQSYIKGHYKVLRSQHKHLSNLLCWANNDSLIFVAHIISCQLYKYKNGDEGYVPIPYVVRERFCKDAEVQDLVNCGIIERKVIDDLTGHTYSVEHGICTKYRVKEEIIEEFIRLEDLTAAEYMTATKVNLFNGKRCQAINKSKLSDHNNNAYPKLIVEAIKCIDSCIIELAPVEAHIKELKLNMLGAAAIYGEDSDEYQKARGQYYNDNACLKNALNQNPEEILPGFYRFTPDYSVSYPGRIHTFMQNASREMKDAAFKNVKNLRNYDLRSSQAIGLIQQFEIAGLDTKWLEDYKNNKQAKYDYAAEIGISVDTWKRCLCALLMGGYLPKNSSSTSDANSRRLKESSADIMRYLMEEAQGDLTKSIEYLSKFSMAVKPLKVELDKWHEWLLSTYAKKIGNYAAGKLYLTNPTGSRLCIDDLPKGKDIWQRKAKVAAFVLQGQEAAFIHQLTILSLQYDYKVLQNEHDGLITVGAVPQEAVDKAAVAAGMKYAVLDEKSFV